MKDEAINSSLTERLKVTEDLKFTASYAKGLICMPMAPEYTDKLHLPQMCITNTDNHCTAFSVSVDHVSTTTGISAYERGIIARKFVDDDAKPEDFRRPGHMFQISTVEKMIQYRKEHEVFVERVPTIMELGKYDEFYLRTKQEKMGHLLNYK